MSGKRVADYRKRLGMSQVDLAEKTGSTKMQISRLEAGKRRLTEEWRIKIAAALRCTPDDLLDDDPYFIYPQSKINLPLVPVSELMVGAPFTAGQRDLPIRGWTMAPEGTATLAATIDYTWRTPELSGVQDAFAVYMQGVDMDEALTEGTILLIHPHAPVRSRDYCLIVLTSGAALVRRMLSRTATEYLVRQYTPALDTVIAASDVAQIYRICGTQMP